MKERNDKLDIKAKLIVAKDLKVSGRQYKAGDLFTDPTAAYRWKLKMWKAGYLVTPEDSDRVRVSLVKEVVPEVVVVQEEAVVTEIAEEVIEEVTPEVLVEIAEEVIEEVPVKTNSKKSKNK